MRINYFPKLGHWMTAAFDEKNNYKMLIKYAQYRIVSRDLKITT